MQTMAGLDGLWETKPGRTDLFAERMYQIGSAENRMLNQFAAAYFQHTQLPPDQVEMVREIRNHTYVWYFRPKAAN